ncbi:MAG: hypothetical protein A2Y25_04990 [Candidatus Melainabacteria bacterium GWF2_37_15]|nr:MAG: hypothetical protein A2Y25_04990 [Candidatus Melainabacteria bacterium GWF2_37_15]
MEKNPIEKLIDYYINGRNNIWYVLIVSVGGTLTLMFSLDSTLKIIFFIIGIMFSFGFLIEYWRKAIQIKRLIIKLKEGIKK